MSLIRNFNLKNAKKVGVDLAGATLGFVGAFQVSKLLKQNTLPVNAGIAIAGVGTAIFFDNAFVQLMGIGAAVYGGIKAINNLTTATTPITETKGVDGILPEGMRDSLAKAFPALGEVVDFGSSNDTRLDEAAIEVRAINGFIFNGDEPVMSGASQVLMMS